MALWNLFTPNLGPPLALFHAVQVILGVQKLGADVNELDGWSTSGSACDFCTSLVLIEARCVNEARSSDIKGDWTVGKHT